jgi:hypothetical protein
MKFFEYWNKIGWFLKPQQANKESIHFSTRLSHLMVADQYFPEKICRNRGIK